MTDELSEALKREAEGLKREAYLLFQVECYAKDVNKLSTDLIEREQEICRFMCSPDLNKDPNIMLPEEYADLRGWYCYRKDKGPVPDPTVRIFEILQEIKEALCQQK